MGSLLLGNGRSGVRLHASFDKSVLQGMLFVRLIVGRKMHLFLGSRRERVVVIDNQC